MRYHTAFRVGLRHGVRSLSFAISFEFEMMLKLGVQQMSPLAQIGTIPDLALVMDQNIPLD